MKQGINVLSLFDGISGCQVALKRLGVDVNNYYASEIDKYAIAITQHNFPDTRQLGDVTKWEDWDIDFGTIDLVTGGFPCQAWSVAGRQLGDKDKRGMLFWTMLDIMSRVKESNPNVVILIENVKMKKEFEDYITLHTENALGKMNKYFINSALLSAQSRNRIYWANINGVEQPTDKGLVLKDIIESGNVDRDKSYCIDANYFKGGSLKSYLEKKRRQIDNLSSEPFRQSEKRLMVEESGTVCGRVVGRKINQETGKRDDYNDSIQTEQRFEPRYDQKTGALTTVQKDNVLCIQTGEADINAIDVIGSSYDINGKSPTVTSCGGGHREPKITTSETTWRKLTPLECERLQTLDDRYTLVPHPVYKDKMMSDHQRYKAVGNGWTIDVIAHILNYANLQERG